MYKAIQELQEQHDAPASKFTYYLGWLIETVWTLIKPNWYCYTKKSRKENGTV
jgi:hypothetical protein